METFEDYGEIIHVTEESIPTETSQILTVFNKTIHHEDDSSDDKSVIEIEPPKENGEHEIGKQDKLLTTKFPIEIDNRKVEGLITYLAEQQISNSKLILGESILNLHYMSCNAQFMLSFNIWVFSYNRESRCHNESKSLNKIL